MDNILAILLALLEMTFVFVTLALLHSQRKIIGRAAFYVCAGLLFVFAQLVAASSLQITTNITGFDFYISSTALTLPFLAALLLIYITEGTLAAQQLIIGCLASYGFFLYLTYLTMIQCNWAGFSISQGSSADMLNSLLSQTRVSMSGSVLALVADLFLLPIFFQRLRNVKCRMFLCVLGSMIFAQIIDSFIYLSVTSEFQPFWWLEINNSLVIKSIATAWLSILITMYLSKVEKESISTSRSALDIFFAFFGSYGKAQALERNLREWEGRYKLLVENASEMIMLVSSEGKVLEANRAASRIVSKSPTLIGVDLTLMLTDEKGKPLGFEMLELPESAVESRHQVKHFRCFAPGQNESQVYLDMAMSRTEVSNVAMYILQGRDITEESRLAREKEILSEQLNHSQRLDSIGKLAGGVAHDFNNHIHAILGHLDLIRLYDKSKDPKIIRHLEKITQISEQAGRLTQQLLGFARKGKYNEEKIDLSELIRHSTELFLPNSQMNMNLTLSLPENPTYIIGDMVQLQQVFINFMINARDAMDDNPPEQGMLLNISVGEAAEFVPDTELNGTAPPDKERNNYFLVTISDNGCGMDKETIRHIFEPFFTTKLYGKGTGMGLAMIYGTITNHRGWIQLFSKQNAGTIFYIYLPKLDSHLQ
ncbi:MAG: ATP-binding protein [Victivallaceae bacterium]